jgi:amidase
MAGLGGLDRREVSWTREAAMGTLLAPFSLSGQPALSLPLHWSGERLPIGLQLVGAPGADETLLALAEALQAVFD